MSAPGNGSAGLAGERPPLTLSALTLWDLPFEPRVEAAAAAGFAGIGLRAEDYVAARESGLDDAAMHEVLARHGIAVTEVELLAGWAPEAGRTPAQRDKEETIFHVARTFGVDHVNAAQFEAVPIDVAAGAFAGLCRRAGDVRVAFEFMPFGGVPDLRSAWRMLREADPPNGGLLVDAWHWARAGTTVHDLAPVPADRIVAVQLCDVAEHPRADMREETLHHRLPPGRGHGDVVGFVRALRAKGVDAMVSVEVMSDDLRSRGAATAAGQVMAAAEAVLAEAR
jgi:sugar phosphate isomerase/epimerase